MLKQLFLSIVGLCIIHSALSKPNFPIKAVAKIEGHIKSTSTKEDIKLVGKVQFTQYSVESGVFVRINLQFQQPQAQNLVLRGLHVHSKPIVDQNCQSAGGHWNPKNVTHGLLTSLIHHAGDLGNIRFSPMGVVNMNIRSFDITLYGDESIINRSVVVHERLDDGGLGDTAASKLSGNAGPKIACGTIVLV